MPKAQRDRSLPRSDWLDFRGQWPVSNIWSAHVTCFSPPSDRSGRVSFPNPRRRYFLFLREHEARWQERGAVYCTPSNSLGTLYIARSYTRLEECGIATRTAKFHHGELRTFNSHGILYLSLPPFQSLPKVAAKIVFTGTKILGRAFAEAGRQAVRSMWPRRLVRK